MGKGSLHSIKPWFTDAGRQTENSSFQDAAHTVSLSRDFFNFGLNKVCCFIIKNGKSFFV